MATEAPTWEETTEIPTWDNTTASVETEPTWEEITPADDFSFRAFEPEVKMSGYQSTTGATAPPVDKRQDLELQQQAARAASAQSEIKTAVLGVAEQSATDVSKMLPLSVALNTIQEGQKAVGLVPQDAPEITPQTPVLPKTELGDALQVVGEASFKSFGPQAQVMGRDIAGGVGDAVDGLIEFFRTPEGLSTLGAGKAPQVAKAALTSAFSGLMASGTGEAAAEAGEKSVTGTPREQVGSTLTALAVPAMAAAPFFHGSKQAELTAENIRPVAPQTADALVEAAKRVSEIPVEEKGQGAVATPPQRRKPSVNPPEIDTKLIVEAPKTAAAVAEVKPVEEVPAPVVDEVPQPTAPLEQSAEKTQPASNVEAKQAILEPDAKPPEIIGMGGAVPSEFVPPKGTTSNKNAVVDAERQKRGLQPMMAALRQKWGPAWDKAMERIDQDATFQDKLIAELKESPRAVEDWENAVLLHRRADLRNEYEKSARDAAQAFDDGRMEDVARENQNTAMWSDRLSELEAVTKSTGTESGRSLAARKMMMNEDFSLAALELEKRAANGGKPLADTPEGVAIERAKLKKIADDYKAANDALEKHLAERDTKLSEMEAQRAIDQIAKEKPTNPYIISVAERIVAGLDKRADAARVRLRQKMGRTSSGVDPTILADLAEIGASHIGHVGLDFAKWSARMIEDVGDWTKPHLQTVWESSQKMIDAQAESMPQSKANKESVKRTVKRQDAKEKGDAIGESIKKKISDGEPDSIGADAQKLARMFVELGVKDRDALIDAVHGELKNYLPEITRRETMDAISGYGKFSQLTKDQISVELRDLKGQMQQVGKLEDMQAGEAPKKTGVERRKPSDEERRLIKQVEEAKKKGGYKVTDPATQLRSALQSTKKRIENQIKDLEYEISTKEKIVRTKGESPTSPEIEALKKRRDTLKAERNEIFGEKDITDAQRLQAFKTRTANRIAELESKMAAGDFAPKEKKAPIAKDATAEKLAYDLELVKRKYANMKEADRIAQLRGLARATDAVLETLNLIRNNKSSADFSGFRQAMFAAVIHPIRGALNFVPYWKATFSDAKAHAIEQQLKKRENFKNGTYARAGLRLVDVNETKLSRMEEEARGRWSQKVPWIRGSNRGFTTFLNQMRVDGFDSLWAATENKTPEAARNLADFVNQSTGYGTAKGKTGSVVDAAAYGLWAPRLLLSRIQLLVGHSMWFPENIKNSPNMKLPGTAETRKLIAKEYARAILGVWALYTVANVMSDDDKKTQLDLSWDNALSPDFAKARIGNSRIDPYGGFQQVVVLANRMMQGETKRLKDGKVIPANEWQTASGFARTKAHPILGMAFDYKSGKYLTGEKVTAGSMAADIFVPLNYRDIVQVMEEQGIPKTIALEALAAFGIGLQTHDSKDKN